MAISNHSWEWKRVIFMAQAGGVRFCKTWRFQHGNHGFRHPEVHVLMTVPHHDFFAPSMWQGALKALSKLGVSTEFLPDAAKTRAGRPPATN